MAVAIRRSDPPRKLPSSRSELTVISRPEPAADEIQVARRRAPAWRAPSAEALLALTLLLGLLLNLAAFLDPHLFSGLSGRLGHAEPRAPHPPGWSELLLAGVPLLSGLALLGLGSFCRSRDAGSGGGA